MEITKQEVEKRVSEFINKSKELGLKVTPQRTAIYKELAKTDQHPSTEAISGRCLPGGSVPPGGACGRGRSAEP